MIRKNAPAKRSGDPLKQNVLIVHGGGPTAVLNASLYGAVREAARHPAAGKVYGAVGGVDGVLRERFAELSALPEERLRLLLGTPASAIGTSRTRLEAEDYQQIVKICRQDHIGAMLWGGGNGSMDACGKLCKAVRAAGENIAVVGIPKTIDNDIAVTDHSPGYGSAARYLAATVSEIRRDVAAMPIHVCIVESMGRNAGWLAAAATLAFSPAGPHRIYLPESPLDEDAFLTEAESLYRAYGCAVIVVSEGLLSSAGNPLGGVIFESGRSRYYGDVGAHLASLITRRLGIKARSEKPGIAGRCSIAHQSQVDREEAVLAGIEAAKAALEGKTGVMIGFERLPGDSYGIRPIHIPIERVMLEERRMPPEFIGPDGGPTAAFTDWCRPLTGGPLTTHFILEEELP